MYIDKPVLPAVLAEMPTKYGSRWVVAISRSGRTLMTGARASCKTSDMVAPDVSAAAAFRSMPAVMGRLLLPESQSLDDGGTVVGRCLASGIRRQRAASAAWARVRRSRRLENAAAPRSVR